MGLLKAAINSVSGTLSDQYKEYFYCDSIAADVLAVKGQKRNGKHSGNNGNDNIISSGSVITVADGQCMIIVDNGKVVEVCSEPGDFVYDSSSEPSIFADNLGDGIKNIIAESIDRLTFGGNAPRTQCVYYFNTKELTGNKYGTPSAVPFRVVDEKIGLDVDISIHCFGEYSYRICNPALFYKNVCGNVSAAYKRDSLDGQLKTELLTALQPAFAKISDMGIRYSSLPAHTYELASALNDVLSAKWRDLRGIEIVSLGVSSVKASEEDEEMIKNLQKSAVFRDPSMAAANLAGAQADAMRSAASNTAGAGMAFMGMNMAAQAGGMNAQDLYQMAAQKPAAQANDSWKCSCGATATGNFCSECGAAKPAASWTCSCGAVNNGKFCTQCGSPKPQA